MKKNIRFEFLALLLIGVITYLPLIFKIGYLNDDWYLMYDGYVGGADFFHNVYSVDRPLRGYLMEMAFNLFATNILYYHISAFVFRVLSALGLFWLCHQLWPKQNIRNWLAAILFLIYPGFLSQLNPVDYQSQIFSLACGMFSVALTIKAIATKTTMERWAYTLISILLGWIYLGLVEYFIGFEALRLVSVIVLFWRDYEKTVISRVNAAIRAFLPFAASAGGFLIWRLFFFEAERKATDVSLQLSSLFTSPLTGLWWLNYLIQDVFKTVFVAWGFPLNNFAFSLRLRDSFIGLGFALLAILVFRLFIDVEDADETEADHRSAMMREGLCVAIVTIIAGLLPVILVNRHVILPDYSRYTLASAAGVAILLSILFQKISIPSLRFAVPAFFLAIAVLGHFGNSVRAMTETEATSNFWWQVAWRVPDIKDGTTLIASYPGGAFSEDYFIWGPANFIYRPEKQTNNPIEIKLPAALLTSDTLLKITAIGGLETPLRRGNYLERDFGNVLVMIQTFSNGCVRIIDGNAPELSSSDLDRLFLVAPFSQADNILTESEFHTPPVMVFGSEPEHDWCFYYQKADLARQRGEWEQIPVLLKEALKNGYYPEDPLEWMPFLQASAILGDVDQVRSMARLIAVDKFLRVQACGLMTEFSEKESLSIEVKVVIEKNICK